MDDSGQHEPSLPLSSERQEEFVALLNGANALLTGGGAGIKLGHNIVVSKDTPLCNAWLTLLHGLGIEAERHGDSSGMIKEMMA